MNAIDTNLLVYAFDLDEARKGPRAIELIASLHPSETVLLWQVACELGAVLTRIGSRARNVPDPAWALASVRTRFPLVLPQESVLDAAWRIREMHQTSIWDALDDGLSLQVLGV
jgi:predicted nucleic acid-binding protein